jgi:hypothetical protein
LPRSKRSDAKALPFRVDQKTRNIFVVSMETSDPLDWQQEYLLSSDRHHDNPHADHDLEERHLNQVVERNAGWLDGGDMSCLMAGRYDPRRARVGVMRSEHAEAADYIDSVVDAAGKFYGREEWARRCVFLSRGNHEQSILKNNDTDVVARIAERMTLLSGHRVRTSGYGGFVKFVVRIRKQVHTLTLAHFHGSGGGGMMTFDTLRVRRQASFVDADILWCGHVHERWWLETAKYELRSEKGLYRVGLTPVHHVRSGCYKAEGDDYYGGWATERGMPPKPLGAVWMRLFFVHEQENARKGWRLKCDFRPTD